MTAENARFAPVDADTASVKGCHAQSQAITARAGKVDGDGELSQVQALCGIDATAAFECAGHGDEELQEGIQDYGMAKVAFLLSSCHAFAMRFPVMVQLCDPTS